MTDSLQPHGLYPTWLLRPWDSPPMGFSRQEHWSGLPFPSPGDLPNPGIEPRSPALQVDALTSEPPAKLLIFYILFNKVLTIYPVLRQEPKSYCYFFSLLCHHPFNTPILEFAPVSCMVTAIFPLLNIFNSGDKVSYTFRSVSFLLKNSGSLHCLSDKA